MLVIGGIMPFAMEVTTALIMLGNKNKIKNMPKKADVRSKFVFTDLNALLISSSTLFLSKSEGKTALMFSKKFNILL